MTMTLGDLRLGTLAAESDRDLFNYFLVTPIAKAIVTQNVGLVLGRKGSGKTALFRQAEELLKEFGRDDVEVVRLNMDDHAWSAFQDFRTLGLAEEHAATVSWHLALLLQISIAVAQRPLTSWSNAASPDVRVIRQFLEDNFGELSPSLAKSNKLIGQLDSLRVGAFGTGLEATFGAEGTRKSDLVPGLTDALSQHLVAPMHDGSWLLLLDQLDESWDGSDDKRSLLVGLLKAVKRLNDDFGWYSDPDRGVRAIAFLRTDIHEALDFDDKDKSRDMTVRINWTPDQLRDMVQARLGGTSVDDIFESRTAQKKGRIPKGSLNYLVSRTFMRPRDLLQYLLSIRDAYPDAEVITRVIVKDVEPNYSRDKLDDLRQEYRKGAPWVDSALDAFKQGPNKFDSRIELEERLSARFDNSKFDSKRMASISDLVDWLVEVSVLGSAPRQVRTESIVFRCENSPVSLEGESTSWIHPALFSGLSLSEPRAARR